MSSQLLPDSTSRALTVTYSLCSLTAEGSFAAFPLRLRDELLILQTASVHTVI